MTDDFWISDLGNVEWIMALISYIRVSLGKSR
jgi:hypothetical protein